MNECLHLHSEGSYLRMLEALIPKASTQCSSPPCLTGCIPGGHHILHSWVEGAEGPMCLRIAHYQHFFRRQGFRLAHHPKAPGSYERYNGAIRGGGLGVSVYSS